ncbi:hypothetical protein DB30_00451 [Enhygromyxa salina]|uniref:Lipoprotein n=1 Tax=Enhygromyxa salina TaxID=215803 RepID=A0A0C1ZQL1_9BACT|nr:hypothetical protein [Enhygromyxa salina]KIG13228.1 hypothetical protein DB30_00451 [Enhygromyxa salina]
MRARHYPTVLLVAALVGCSGATPPANDPDPTPPALPDLVQACSGTAIDLRWISDNLEACPGEAGTWVSELPERALAFRIEPAAPRITSGQTAFVDYVLTNASDDPVAVEFGLFCTVRGTTTTILSTGGDPVDIVRCGGGGGCGNGGTVIPLEPGSDARVRVEVSAVRNIQDEDCTNLPAEPLEPGNYQLRIDLGDEFPVLEVPLVVDSGSP